MNPAALLARAGECGFTLVATETGWQLLPVVDGAIMPPALLAELKRHREQLIAHLTCGECGGQTFDARFLERLRSCLLFCDRSTCPYRRT